MKKPVKILVVDDEPIVRESLRDWLSDSNHDVLIADNGPRALELIEKERPGIALIDLVMPGMNGIDLLKKAKELSPEIEVIIITAYGSIPTAIDAVKQGAYDYIEKPFCPEKAELLIDKLLEHRRLVEENICLLDHRRKRNRQGTRGKGNSCAGRPQDEAVRRGQLCRTAREPSRERALWAREGGFHGSLCSA
jgi:DNA-binding NtrC family response regulator